MSELQQLLFSQFSRINPFSLVGTDNTAPLRHDRNRSESISSRIPMARWGQPDDIAGVAVFLASKAAKYINGEILAVDGGWLAR